MTKPPYASSVPAPEDREAALFDLLAGWAEYVEAKGHRGHETGTAADGAVSWPYVSRRWRSRYTAPYLRRILSLTVRDRSRCGRAGPA